MNTLYYGDNLDVLRLHVPAESVDLVYLDPPFQSNRDYNVLFVERSGERAAAQIKAFEDTWEWNIESQRACEELIEQGGAIAEAMIALRAILKDTDMMAYLAMMAPRLVELRRVMKSTATIFLHCDPTASHYLKMIMDAVFGPTNFRNEIIWKRSSAHSDAKQGMKRCGKIHDVIFFYSKTNVYKWNTVYTPYTAEYLESEYRHKTRDGRYYKETDLTAAKPGGDVSYDWHVKRLFVSGKNKPKWEADLEDEYLTPDPDMEYLAVKPYQGRFWAYSKDNLRTFAKEGKLIHRATGMPRLVQYSDEMPGIPLQDVWDDIPPASGDQDMHYPTQKPEALLERVVALASDKGDVLLDPFCGCGTAIYAAQKLERSWFGIDITHLAIGLIKSRLRDAFLDPIAKTYKVIGEPTTVEDAEELAKDDPYQFQWWALGLVGARRVDEKKGADKGIDGRLFFHDEGLGGKTKQVILSVKAGKLHATYVRDLRGVVEREKADLGVLIAMDEPTKLMRAEAASAGFYKSHYGTDHPRIQILTIQELLSGQSIDYPAPRQTNVTIKRAARAKAKDEENKRLF